MQLTLRPLSNPELSDIVVSNGYLAIGRRELPFSLYDQQLADTLSRRHARLFEQNDQFHLVDLDSSNGTTVNGREIDDHPVLLKQGDVVTFADHLSYQVDIGGPDKALELDQPTRYIQRNKTPLYLVLESKNPALDTIVIKTFPFLISKDDAVFSRYEKIAPEEVAFLSRKHAYIFQDGEHFFVEELGSTNGTFVNSERLDEKSRQLEGGDILSFGGDYFCYEVHPGGVNPASAPNPGSDKTSTQRVGETFPPEDSEKTTFITSATSFLDIFCQPDEPSAKVVDSPVDEEVAESSDHEYRKTPLGSVFGAPWLWLKKTGDKFRLTLTRGITWLRDWRILSILLAVVVATVFMVTQLFDGEKQRIEQRCAEGAFKDCAVLAGRYLKKQGSPDPYIAGLASKALLKSVVPDWLAKLEKGDFTAADQIMTEAETITAPGTEGAEIVDLLRQIQGVEYYISQRGGPDGAIQMFAHEKIIQSILSEWDKDRSRIVMTRIVQAVPDFEVMRQRVQSHIRLLRSDKSRYLSAITEFKTRLKRVIAKDEKSARREVERFASRFSRVSGIDNLRDDLEHYYAIVNADIDLIEQLQQFQQVSFKTPLVQQQVEKFKAEVLPPADISRQLQKAQAQWRQGQLSAMEKSLQKITEAPWQAYATQWLERSRKIESDYLSLKNAEGQTTYEKQLLNFRAALNPSRDQWFIDATEKSYKTYRQRALSRIKAWGEKAARNWARYQKAGGIQTRQRLDDQVTKKFRQNASWLAKAYKAADEARQLAADFGIVQTDDELSIWKAIQKERRLQLGSIEDLEGILKADVIRNKLKLLRAGD